jgi:Flp pilus assembly protein TadD
MCVRERTGLERLQSMISVVNQSIKFETPLAESVRATCMTMLPPAKPLAILGLLALLLAGCEALDGLGGQPPSVNLDRNAVARVATAAQDSGEYATAAGVYEKYAAAHPGDAVAQAGFAEAALEAGDMDKASESFQKALALAPDRVDARMGLGRIYLARHKPNQALTEFQAMIAADPKNLRALNGAGIALDLLGRNREAQQSYRAALALKPDDRAVRNNLGLSLALSGNYDQAIAELSKLTLEQGATSRMRQNLALALSLKGDDAAAAKIEHADLDDAAIAENKRFFAAVRRLTQGGDPVVGHGPFSSVLPASR